MADAREPYLVQVNAIKLKDGTPTVTKVWMNIYYITSIYQAQKDHPLYRAGARWYAVFSNGVAVLVDDDDCEKIITNINGSY